jgi:anti-sigma regulatory factor (Ser/Thr protein kinase)
MTAPGYVHDALFCSDDDDLLDAAVPFLRAGLEGGDSAVVVCTDESSTVLGKALDDPRLQLVPQDLVYRNAVHALDAYARLLRSTAGARRVRLVGEVAFGDDPARWSEWERFEALCNHVLAPYPLWSVCAYDRRRLAPEVVDIAWATHPHVVRGTARFVNDRYQEPAEVLRRTESGPDAVEQQPPTLDTVVGTELLSVRLAVLAAALDGGRLGRARVDDFVVAVSEVVTNARVHGHPPVRLRWWATADRLVCTVTDEGPGVDDPLLGYRPATDDPLSASGLWLARRLVDRLELCPGPTGFTVRLTSHR